MSDKMTPNDSGISSSPWMRESVPDLWAELPAETRVDVCVIGAGISGLSVAYHLMRANKTVLVIDDGPIGGGETGRTSAHLASALDDRFYDLESRHGERGARLAAQSHAAAIDDIEAIVHGEHIACDFRRVDGYLFAPPGADLEVIHKELAAARRAGLECELVPKAPLPGFSTGPCIRFARQAQFHPIKYLRGVAEAIIARGGRIATGVRAEAVEGGSPARVVTEGNRVILADAVVVATNAPISSRVKLPAKEAQYRTYMIAMEIPRRSAPLALYWDTLDPYHYARVIQGSRDSEYDMVIVGGEDHKVGQDNHADARFDRLAEWTRERFVGATHICQRWSGQIIEPVDGLAYIGKDPSAGDHVYVVTGDSGNGLTHGTIAGMLITDQILGRKNEWTELYDPSRSARHGAREWLKQNLNTAAQYADWVGGGDVRREDEILPGQGAVVRHGVRLMAVYRDEAGHCHHRSAVCPHLGGIVSWNAAEKSWDCPAHGSRFDCLGRVINGPANADLAVTEAPGARDEEPAAARDTEAGPSPVFPNIDRGPV
jgi:glycine/D-amino acid oxidase-like deaminating enzyme/nitrite reductase/ring-hydroxylating ferredoxin subunit